MITAVPTDKPRTVPDAFTDATVVLLLLQVPPGVASVSVADELTQIVVMPEMGATEVAAFTVNTLVAYPVPQAPDTA